MENPLWGLRRSKCRSQDEILIENPWKVKQITFTIDGFVCSVLKMGIIMVCHHQWYATIMIITKHMNHSVLAFSVSIRVACLTAHAFTRIDLAFSLDVFEEYSRDSRLAGTGQLFVHLDETKPFWFTSPSCPCCHKSRIDCSGRFFVIVRGYQTKFLSKTVRKICEKGSRQLSYIMDGWWMDENLFYHVLEDEPLCPR